MSAIYRNSPLPRYFQLKEIMRERIRSGEWKPGELIPSERELSEKYGTSLDKWYNWYVVYTTILIYNHSILFHVCQVLTQEKKGQGL